MPFFIATLQSRFSPRVSGPWSRSRWPWFGHTIVYETQTRTTKVPVFFEALRGLIPIGFGRPSHCIPLLGLLMKRRHKRPTSTSQPFVTVNLKLQSDNSTYCTYIGYWSNHKNNYRPALHYQPSFNGTVFILIEFNPDSQPRPTLLWHLYNEFVSVSPAVAYLKGRGWAGGAAGRENRAKTRPASSFSPLPGLIWINFICKSAGFARTMSDMRVVVRWSVCYVIIAPQGVSSGRLGPSLPIAAY